MAKDYEKAQVVAFVQLRAVELRALATAEPGTATAVQAELARRKRNRDKRLAAWQARQPVKAPQPATVDLDALVQAVRKALGR